MPIDVIAQSFDFLRQMETIILADDLGATKVLMLGFSGTDRASAIANSQAAMLANQNVALSYVAAAGYPAPTYLSFAQKQTSFVKGGGAPAMLTTSPTI